MDRRSFLSAMAATPVLAALLAACGDDSVAPADTGTPGTGGDTTTPTAGTIAHPTGADEMVFRVGYEGGFTSPGYLFMNIPTLLVSGDGRVVQTGATPAIYPGPLLPALMERSIDEAGIQTLLAAAKDAGLLASPPDYSLPDGIGIADAADSVVRINANGASYVHSAYALDITQSESMASTPARDNLAAFIATVSDLETLVGAEHLGAEAPLVASQYRFQAMVVDPAQYTDIEPTVVPWPAGTGVVLADAAECGVVAADAVGSLFADATQLTFFQEGEAVYQLSVIAVLPGDTLC
ncbi:MAG: hypothetical protein RL238_705 [Actinomycetota bacterium]|jgi:hypothetical protein